MIKYNIKDIRKYFLELDAIVSKLFSHPVVLRLVWFLSNFTKISPNTVTILAFIFRVAAAISILFYNPILIAIFAYTSHVLDGADGILARVTNRVSKIGGILDPILDKIGISLLFCFLSIHLFLIGEFITSTFSIVFLLMYFNQSIAMSILSTFKKEDGYTGKKRLETRIKQLEKIFGKTLLIPIKIISKVTSKFKMNPIPTLFEVYFILFIVAPFLNYPLYIFVIGLLLFIPEFSLSFIRLFNIFALTKKINVLLIF